MKSLIFCLVLLVPFLSTSHADVIGVGAFDTGGVGPLQPSDSVTFQFGKFQGDFSPPLFDVFDGIPLRPSDSGRTFKITLSDDPDFAPLVAVLTNGIDDRLKIKFTVPGGASSLPDFFESQFFFGGLGPIDFRTATITSIDLHVDDLSFFLAPGSNLQARMQGEIIIEGFRVAEPLSLTLLGLGSLCIFASRWRH
jgi:hypothetical protein